MSRRIKNIIIFLLVLSVAVALNSEEIKNKVESISVFGNIKAGSRMIKRVITLKEGKPFTDALVTESRERLEKLGIFKLVDIESRETENGVIVIINVQEGQRFYIDLRGVLNDRDSREFQFNEEAEKNHMGVTFGIKDFAGRQQTFEVNTGVGKLFKIGLLYRKEYFSKLSWGVEVKNVWFKSSMFETDIEKLTGRFFIGQQLNRFFLRLWGGYDRVKTDGDFIIPDYSHEFLRTGLDLNYDSRNLRRFPSRGIFAGLGSYKVFDTSWEKVYDRYKIELAGFLKVFNKSVIAVDAQAILSDGVVPFNEKIYFGGFRTLRGLPVGEYFGDQALLMSVEYRVPFGGIGRKQGGSKFLGAAVYLFADFGLLADKVKAFDFDDLEYDTGVGFTWAVRKEFTIRFDLSVSPKFRLTVGTGWKF